ncbi:MAG: diaminopimelate decarboxylase family protein [Promethearchaeota archaeon]|jgi:diaminopimelate decarboxylase
MKNISGNPYLAKKNGRIFIDSIPLDELTKNHKTPLLIFIEKRIKDNIHSFISTFKDVFKNFHCFYSLKANFLTEICTIISSEGVGAKVVSLPELRLAIKVGFSPNNIIIGSIFLPDDLIEMSIKKKVKEIIVYNIRDLKRINSIAQKFNRVQNICIRINSQKFDSKLGLKFDDENIEILKKSILKFRNIKFTSILSHFGTQMNNIKQFEKNMKSLTHNLKTLLDHNILVENLNFGGGFPEATVMTKDKLKEVALTMKKHLDGLGLQDKSIYLEPGRYFVGDSGFFLSKIVQVSKNRWIFLDIGNHICPKFARCSLRFYNATQITEPHKYKTSIAGIVPTDQDVLAKNYFFTQNLKEDDIVMVTNTGAYCLTFSNRFPFPLPKIFLVSGGIPNKIFDSNLDMDFSLH